MYEINWYVYIRHTRWRQVHGYMEFKLHQINFTPNMVESISFISWCPHLSIHFHRPIFSVLANSDEESSSADSSDEEEPVVSEPRGPVGEKGPTTPTDG